jgi:apolipoprotein N-acyltransferase
MTHDLPADQLTDDPLIQDDGRPSRSRASWVRRVIFIVLALLAGAGAALAHPPFGLLPGLVAYPLMMLLIQATSRPRSAALVGWTAGFAYFLISCWWVAEAFLVNPDQAWMAPFAASLLPAGLGLFWAVAFALHRRLAPDHVLLKPLVFAALFMALEWLRGHVLTGFPWNPAGASWGAGSAASQFAAIGGVYGLGLVTVAGCAMVGALFLKGRIKSRIGVAALGVLVLAALVVSGQMRLSRASITPTQTLVRIVQADVSQQAKWTPENFEAIVERYVNLTARSGAGIPDIVVWPEGALPTTANEAFAEGSPVATAIARALQPGQVLLLGLSRGELGPDGEPRYFNSLFALHDEGPALRIAAVYDKHRLVPFGEYLPLGSWMGPLGIRSLVHVPADFSAGPRPAPIDLPGRAPRVQPLICYESLYPGFTPGGASRPAWIANVSNDAWFGATSGPLQHLNLASYRAIETGLPVVRATPTGVSALIDPWGRVVPGRRLDSGESGVIDAFLPAPLTATPYGRIGDWAFGLVVLLLLGPGLLFRFREKPKFYKTTTFSS